MKLLQQRKYLVSFVDKDVHKGSSSHSADYASMFFQ